MDFKRLDTVKSCLLAIAAAATIPAAEAAHPATAAAQGTPPTSPATGGQSAPADGGAAPTNSSSGGHGLNVPSGVIVHQLATLSGNIPGAGAGAPVAIERLDSTRGTWTVIASTVTGQAGSFVARWRADHIGRFTLRAIPGGAGTADTSGQSQAPTAQMTVYRPAVASWFGPGFYGHRTACGETMSPTLLGVAHRSLPCGTLVDVSYGGHSITVPVVDRGPYRHGVSWDLTTATAQALGLTETARVGALALRSVVPAPDATATAPSQTSSSSTQTSSSSTQTSSSSTQSGGARAASLRR